MSKKQNAEDDFLNRVQGELIRSQSRAASLGVCEFVETLVDAFDTPLFLSQRVILKSIFGEALDDARVDPATGLTESQLMDRWVANDCTNWRDPNTVLAEANMELALKGEKPRPKFCWQNITLQCGMRCLSGNSYIFTERGGFQRLDEMLPTATAKDIQSVLFNRVQTRFGMKPVTDGLSRSARCVINVRSRYGYEVGGSEQHPLLVMDKSGDLVWKKMPEIERGDFLCIARNGVPFCEEDRKFEFEGQLVHAHNLARIAGLLVGDGSLTVGSSVGLTTMDAQIRDEYLAFCTETFGKVPAVYEKSSGDNKAKDYRLHSTKARKWLAKVAGLDYSGAYEKKVPSFVRQGSQETVRQFLRGLFDTDGFASTRNTMIGLATASERLAKEVQVLLSGFGIICSRKFVKVNYTRQSGEQSTCWKIEINGPDAIKFRDFIGFGLERKQRVADTYKAYPKHGQTVDTIPNLHGKLRRLKAAEGMSPRGSGQSQKWNNIRKQCTNQTRRNNKEKAGGITYRLLPEVIDYFDGVAAVKPEVAYLRNLKEQNLFFDEVVETWDTFEPVYDICVPGPHEYVANGIVSHNSSKSSMVALAIVYRAFKLFAAENPQKALGIPSTSPIYLTVVASTERQTLGTIFYYVKSYIERSTYFKTLIANGECLVTELEIKFPKKNIIIASGHSRATSIVGRTAIFVAFDELAMFSADEGHTSNAADVYQRVGMSAMTFPYDAQRVALSSVKEQGDYVEHLVEHDWDKQANGCLVFDLTTFEVNPTLTRETPLIKSVYDHDQVAAERDFENIRPGVTGAFLNAGDIDRAMEGNDPQAHATYADMPIQRRRGEAERKEGESEEFREMSGLSVSVKPAVGVRESFGHCDPARVHDSFGFACGHPEWSPAGVVTVVDLVLEWIPRMLPGGKKAPVDYVNVEDVLSDVARKRRMRELGFDIFNSESTIQRLYREGVMTHVMPFSAGEQKAMYDSLRTRLQQGLVKLPNHPSLREEMESLILKNGTRVDHPHKKPSKIKGKIYVTKDIVDCVAAVNYRIARMERDFVRGQYQGAPPSLPSSTQGSIRTVGQTSALNNVRWHNR